MGFRQGAWAKCWEVRPVKETRTDLRISISRKNKQTDEYEQEFSGYVSVFGTAAAAKASRLHEGDRIRLGDVDVSNRYDPEKRITYTNYRVFSFQTAEETGSAPANPRPEPDAGEPDDISGDDSERSLPF